MSDGARFKRKGGNAVRVGDAQVRSPALEGGTVELKLDFAAPEIKTPRPNPGKVAAVLTDVLRKVGLKRKVTGRAVRNLKDGAFALAGRYRNGEIAVDDAASDPLGAARHEIIHALRDKALWGRPYGLFTREEWRALVRAARADKDLMARIRRDYPDLGAAAQVEEAVAEMYREWAAARDAKSPVGRLMQRLSTFFKAIASALKGQGFTTAARVFERIERGDFGGRGEPTPTGPGGGFKASREARQTWRENLRAFPDGKIQPHETMSLGPVPEIVKTFGGRGRDLVMAASKLRKVLDKHKGLKPETIANLPDLIADPFMIIGDRTDDRTADILVVTDHTTRDGDVVVVAIKRSGTDDKGRKASVVVTLHGRDRLREMVALANDSSRGRNRILYVRGEREGSGYRHTGNSPLNASLSDTLRRLRYDRKIRTPRTVFKSGEPPAGAKHMRRNRDAGFESAPHVMAKSIREGEKKLLSDLLTQAMAGKNGWNVLALVPGRALMEELGAKIPSIKTYLRLKERMDERRNEKHEQMDRIAQDRRKLAIGDRDANDRMMRLMHDSTIIGQDPSKPFVALRKP
ncbi:hypothetical protein SAMN05421751_10988 [Jhaorihella thermophila]|uniref:Death domain-containing protein n=2 Tax=Jhaorihella thermophila TaxID=488547 RepID=A0A1H5WZP4_9RHOB|nr:hypothetical protein SAMN05421751_10988 [Jhaorihella thermophila]